MSDPRSVPVYWQPGCTSCLTAREFLARHGIEDASILEPTASHVAQHCRQLESLVRLAGIDPDGPLGPAELQGLPLPAGRWDREVQ